MPRSATSKRRLSKNQRIEIRARIDLFMGLERAAQPPRFAQLARMPPRALPQRARARIARAVDTASRWRPFAIGAAPLAHARGNASRTQPVALPAHQARCRIALRTAVHVASGANVTGRLRTTAAKKNGAIVRWEPCTPPAPPPADPDCSPPPSQPPTPPGGGSLTELERRAAERLYTANPERGWIGRSQVQMFSPARQSCPTRSNSIGTKAGR